MYYANIFTLMKFQGEFFNENSDVSGVSLKGGARIGQIYTCIRICLIYRFTYHLNSAKHYLSLTGATSRNKPHDL